MKALRKERLERGWTLVDLQEKTGIRKESISRIERGIEQCWPAWRSKLENTFGIPIEVLLRDMEYELVETGEYQQNLVKKGGIT